MNAVLNEYQSEKIAGLDNNMVTVFIFYTNPQLLAKYYNRYLKKPLRFISTRQQDSSSPRCIRSFLKNYPKAWKMVTDDHGDFGSRQAVLQGRLWNMVVVLSIVDFDDAFVREISDYLLSVLKTSLPINAPEAKYISMFIRQRGKILGTSFLRKLLKICLDNPVLHAPEIYEAFADIRDSKKINLVTTPATFAKIKSIFEEKQATNNIFGRDLFYSLFLVSRPAVKKMYTAFIERQLKQKFQLGMYFKASFMKIIASDLYWTVYLDSFETPASNPNRTSVSFGEVKLQEINNLMNLVFKLNLTLPASFIQRLKGFSNYYDWLLDMQNFDYSLFNPLWILQYQSWFYYQRIFAIEQVRSAVREYLRKQEQPQLGKIYTLHVEG